MLKFTYLPIDNTKIVLIGKNEVVVIEKLDDLSHGHNFPNEWHQFMLRRFNKSIHYE